MFNARVCFALNVSYKMLVISRALKQNTEEFYSIHTDSKSNLPLQANNDFTQHYKSYVVVVKLNKCDSYA